MEFARGQILEPWLNPKLRVRPSALHGQGFFAQETIPAGEPVIKWGGTVYDGTDLLSGKVRLSSAVRLGDDLYLGDHSDSPAADYYLNHSCYPNVWLIDDITLVARIRILAGTELTADYATWESGPNWVLEPCRCGSSLCRKSVTGDDWRLPELRLRYAGHLSRYLRRLLAIGG